MPTYSNSASVSSNISDGGSVGAWSANGVGGGLSAWLSNATPVPDYTDYIAATGFGFAIPSNETIVGIEADYPVKAFFGTGFSGTARDHSVLLTVGGVPFGTDHVNAASTYSTVIFTTQVRGGSADNWGGLTPAQANNSTFGLALSCQKQGGVNGTTLDVELNSVTITITTTVPPVQPVSPMHVVPPFAVRSA